MRGAEKYSRRHRDGMWTLLALELSAGLASITSRIAGRRSGRRHPEDPIRGPQPCMRRGAPIRCQLLAESEVLEQESLLPHEEGPDRVPDDGEQERHPPNLAEDEDVNDI